MPDTAWSKWFDSKQGGTADAFLQGIRPGKGTSVFFFHPRPGWQKNTRRNPT